MVRTDGAIIQSKRGYYSSRMLPIVLNCQMTLRPQNISEILFRMEKDIGDLSTLLDRFLAIPGTYHHLGIGSYL